MKLLIYILFIFIFIFIFIVDFVVNSIGIIPRVFSWIPEVLSGIAVLVVCVHIAKNRIIFIPTRYVIFFSFLFAFLVVGIVANQAQPGAVFAGIRKYFRYTPFFCFLLYISLMKRKWINL